MSTRLIDGKRFTLYVALPYKRDAKRAARQIRMHGDFARVIKGTDLEFPWQVWVR